MTIEEKTKAYDEAIKRVEDIKTGKCETTFMFTEGLFDYIFPELKESEDELTWLTKYIEEEAYSLSMDIRDNEDRIKLKNLRKALAWLEKQSGCHISHDDEIMIEQLTEYFTTGHGLQNTNETVVEWLNDVKEKLEKQAEVVSDKDDIEAEEKGIRKAFNKIWEEKQDKQKSQRMISAEAKEAMYDKPVSAWSEEDGKIFDRICDLIHSAAYENYDVDEDGKELGEYAKIINWFKFLKDRYTWKPSDEQMHALHDLNLTGNISYAGQGQVLIGLYNDLKKLREE